MIETTHARTAHDVAAHTQQRSSESRRISILASSRTRQSALKRASNDTEQPRNAIDRCERSCERKSPNADRSTELRFRCSHSCACITVERATNDDDDRNDALKRLAKAAFKSAKSFAIARLCDLQKHNHFSYHFLCASCSNCFTHAPFRWACSGDFNEM